ncbi:Fumarylacetoacetate hydrolase domain-containing protein 2 [Purpureocillium lavendulum]|uniref:Fumarylacetoacetate hydrolase domain-containing protein 2 n=1 Tax=Purpureocillium lavendulum TaxID=1247861 RepID=A0AB34FWL7_9HYPO|nr:Fumarylacetoacetate hydrolase domain-containing protein 2 [Purpureocillium lavendulum]
MTAPPTFTNLIRFVDQNDLEHYGDVCDGNLNDILGITVPVLDGDLFNLRQTDEQGELCVIISKTGKNIPEDEALDYVLGISAGNDLSSRYWQRPPRSGGQFTYAKSFDHFAPIGPTILHRSQLTPNSSFQIKTSVNGEIRQNGSTSDMIFGIEQIVAHASKGTTLRQGTVIMTGTPSGIAAAMPGEPWLQHGDVVEVEIDGVGLLRNKLNFEANE